MLNKILPLFRYGFLALIFTTAAYSQYAPDSGFGTDGVTQVDFGPNFADTPNDLVLLPDNKILAAGISINSFDYFISMTRLMPDGNPDTAGFGIDGKVLLHFVLRDQANGIRLQPDGKIVIAGTEAVGNGGSQITPALYRFEENGELDTTFADSGKIAIRFDGVSSGEFFGVSVQRDGKILAAGSSTGNANGGTFAFGAMRFLPDGTLDTSYGINGKARLTGTILYHPVACLFLADTGIIMATVSYLNNLEQFVLGRMDSLGRADTTFGDNGFIVTGIPSVYNFTGGEALALTSDNKILLSGTSYDSLSQAQFSVFRFFPDGTPDPSFGTNGRTDLKLGNYDIPYDLKIDKNEKILIAGGTGSEAALARLNPDGSPDTTFAPGGKLVLNLNNNSGSHYLSGCLPLENGDILVSGYNFASNSGDFLFSRLTNRVTGIEDNSSAQPINFELQQNYPNPFNPSTKINWSMSAQSQVSIVIYDLLGRKIKTLVNDEKPAGKYEVLFDASRLASGVYFYTIHAGSFVQTKKMMLLR